MGKKEKSNKRKAEDIGENVERNHGDQRRIKIRNVPTNVAHQDVTESLATFIAKFLEDYMATEKKSDEKSTIRIEFLENEETKLATADFYGTIDLRDDDESVEGDNEPILLATLQLASQKPKKGKRERHCPGHGFLELKGNEDLIVSILSPKKVADGLSDYAIKTKFKYTPWIKQSTTASTNLIFRYGKEGGKIAVKSLLVSGQAQKEASIQGVGQKLLQLIKEKGTHGTLQLKDWPTVDRRGVNEYGKRRKISPLDAARVAGKVEWDSKKQEFRLIE